MIQFKDTIINPKYFVSATLENTTIKIFLIDDVYLIITYQTEAGAKIGLETLYKLLQARKK